MWSSISLWLSRATGIGYSNYPPLSEILDSSEISVKKEIAKRALRLRQQIDELEHMVNARD